VLSTKLCLDLMNDLLDEVCTQLEIIQKQWELENTKYHQLLAEYEHELNCVHDPSDPSSHAQKVENLAKEVSKQKDRAAQLLMEHERINYFTWEDEEP
jgi:hypothetical protein